LNNNPRSFLISENKRTTRMKEAGVSSSYYKVVSSPLKTLSYKEITMLTQQNRKAII